MKHFYFFKQKIYFLFFVQVFFFLKIYSQATWTEMNGVGMNQPASEVPPQRGGFSGFSINGKGYLGTGYIGSGVALVQQFGDINEYDPSSNKWHRSNTWIPDRTNAYSFSINGRGYVGGGQDYYSGTLLTDTWEYNPVTDSWAQEASFPDSARFQPFSFEVNGKGYIGSGTKTIWYRDFWEFEPLANSWTRKADVSFSITGSRSFTIGTDSYVLGGNDSMLAFHSTVHKYDAIADSWSTVAGFPWVFYSNARQNGFELMNNGYIVEDTILYQYNPVLDQWNIKAPLPYAPYGVPMNINNDGYMLMSDGGVFEYVAALDTWSEIRKSPSHYRDAFQTYNSKAIVIDSMVYSSMSVYNPAADAWLIDSSFANTNWLFSIAGIGYALRSNIFQKYDPSSGIWTSLTPMPVYYLDINFVANGKAYFVFGMDSLYNQLNQVWQYDPVADSWMRKTDYPSTLKNSASAFTLNNNGYVLGGSPPSTSAISDEVWMYDPLTDSWTAKAAFPGYQWGGYRLFATGYNSKAYVGLGMNDIGGVDDGKLYSYNPDSDSWTRVTHPLGARHGVISFSVNNSLYVGMGAYRFDQTYSELFNDVWKYTDSLVQGINTASVTDRIVLFPNPALSKITIQMNDAHSDKNTIEVFDAHGNKVYKNENSFSFDKNKLVLDVKDFKSGIYFLEIINPERTYYYKFLKE